MQDIILTGSQDHGTALGGATIHTDFCGAAIYKVLLTAFKSDEYAGSTVGIRRAASAEDPSINQVRP